MKTRFRLCLAALLLMPISARADQRLTITAPAPLAELVVTGDNTATAPAPVILRIDDQPGADYAGRVNEERVMPPGPFTLRLRLAALRTPRGRALDAGLPWRVIAFAQDAGVQFAPLRLDVPPSLPAGVHGWYFGPGWSPPLAGFEAVQPGDTGLSGPNVVAVTRPGGDAVLAHGVRLTRFAATLPPGRWRLTLWTEDPGEWETLPPVLEQRVRVNGADLLLLRRSYADWVAQRYLAGRDREADPQAPPFAALGALRGGRVGGVVTVGADGALVVELAGFPAGATVLAAMIAEPADGPALGVAAVEAMRAARFAEAWPVLQAPPAAPQARQLALSVPEPGVTAAGGVAILRLEAVAPGRAVARVTVEWDGAALPARVLWGQWRWRRPGANAAGLVFSAAHLRADAGAVPLRADLPRPLVVIVQGTAPGRYRGRVVLRTPTQTITAPIALDVLAAARPAPAARVAAFLDFAPQLLGDPAWDRAPARAAARAQAKCDMAELGRLGLAPLAPPVGRLDDDFDGVIADFRAAAAQGGGPFIAYAPLRALPAAEAPALIARADAALAAAGLPRVAWSVADEVSFNGRVDAAATLARAVHAAAPGALLAGHLNNPGDAALLPQLALATVNPGFGADADDIAALRAAGVQPYLYNMPAPRFAAGAWLWRSGADGLLQWHGRMPTADPFDPTDGREGDVQFLWPTPGVCAPADLDADLLALAEGAEDLRWFAWLDAAAARNPDAAALRRRIWGEVPGHWAAALGGAENTVLWRRDIVYLARKVTD